MKDWQKLVKIINNSSQPVQIGIVGKYFESGKFTLTDSYISVIEAVKHASFAVSRKPVITWVSAEDFENSPASGMEKLKNLDKFDGIIVPGGFGGRGIEGKIKTIEYCRKNKIPFLGLCLGMQLAVIEFARNVCLLKDANSTEFNEKTQNPVIDIMAEQKELLKEKNYGGTMRLGSYKCRLKAGTLSLKAYGQRMISERHRHRYELNNKYRNVLEKNGMLMAGINPQKNLVEIIELPSHPFFAATQFHPEFKSRPLKPHPLFLEFIKSANKQRH